MSEALNRNYRVCEEIGRGRFGVVFKCYSPESGESFAVKSIDKRLIADDSVDRQCLFNEAKIMQLLSPNPYVLRIFDVFEDDDHLHLVIELCRSSDLFERLSARQVFSEAEALAVMVPLMDAIAHCHRLGVAHRDIKPDNVLFNEWDELKLADFGSAECFHESELMSGVVGTPYYVAPEVLAGRAYSEKLDVWSAGVILYIMLAGVPPFYGDSAEEIFEAVLRANLRFPARFFNSVSPAAKDLLRRMLCKDVSRRFSAEQVLSNDFPLDSGTNNVNTIPKKLMQPRTIREFRTPIPGGYPASVFAGSLFCAAYKNPNAPTIAPAFPAAADIPWHVDRNLAGKISAGTTKVVAFGPKLAKKNRHREPVPRDSTANGDQRLGSGDPENFFDGVHRLRIGNPSDRSEYIFLEKLLAVESNV
nr:phosphoenolpyruvate carboxylase kinase 1-like [Ipomoea batatas]